MLSFPCVPYYTVHTRCLKTDRPPTTEIKNSRDSGKGPCRDHDEGDDDIGTLFFKIYLVECVHPDLRRLSALGHTSRPNDPHQIARRCEEECQDDRSECSPCNKRRLEILAVGDSYLFNGGQVVDASKLLTCMTCPGNHTDQTSCTYNVCCRFDCFGSSHTRGQWCSVITWQIKEEHHCFFFASSMTKRPRLT